jgi:hypothetical protein
MADSNDPLDWTASIAECDTSQVKDVVEQTLMISSFQENVANSRMAETTRQAPSPAEDHEGPSPIASPSIDPSNQHGPRWFALVTCPCTSGSCRKELVDNKK